MKNTIIFIFYFLFALSVSAGAQINAEVTYIGNEGFMIKNNNKKMLIDALYSYGNESVALEVDVMLRKKIIENSEPFSNCQLSLVTHDHGDHYSKDMVTNYLKNNPQAKFIAPSGIIKGLSTTNPENQLISMNLARFESKDTTINEIPLTIYNIIHDATYRTYNLGFLANIEGLKIFHGGDNSLEDSTEYIKFKLYEKNIDILFLWNYSKSNWETQKQRDFIKKYINPKYIVLMHIPPSKVPKIKEQINAIDDKSFPPILVFNTSMEKLSITDTVIFTNHMPEKQGALSDTTFILNAPIALDIPKLFKDIDANDSLTYYAPALPKWLSFDSTSMKISGKGEKIGTYTIKIIAKDKSLCANATSFKLIVKDGTSAISSENQNIDFIYPNPASDKIYLNHVSNPNTRVQIYDLDGKMVLNKLMHENNLDISNLTKGIYMIKLIDSERVLTTKLTKK